MRLAQLYATHATVRNAHGDVYEPRTWSEIDVVQWTARQPGARAWYEVPDENLETPRARPHGGGDDRGGAARRRARSSGATARRRSRWSPGITTTLGGLRIDTARARGARASSRAGADAGGIATGGYASGLAAALVFGRIAARVGARRE